MKEDWDEAYSIITPLAGLVIGVLGVSLSLLMLTRSQAQAVGSLAPLGRVDVDVPKVRYANGEIFVEVREPGQWLPMTDFVRPDDPYLYHAIMGALSG